ncbi:serine/arginine repetitive matrix protein 1-like [Patiria miniata]|uniref:Uncharacterized protein n=1 Tax=Patiria miniata TaxID=46514 RepID=A0A914A4K9_PATMI|nr:serine/arginine repetitive matrix protein 1-like [Patiria miniata]XP_038058315.1 serine/arginine repetitive matrix protein 1-like [Patiria miniata]XP_038058316.1 serine/arginine repetitive matrix protein 1-like [Patiria miniata]
MKRFLCTDSLLMLPISGAFLTLLGILLIILYIVARGLTASLYYVEGALPTYVVAVLLILTGAAMIVLLKKRPNLLIYLAIGLNCIVFSLSALQAISVGIVSIPFLGSFSACVYHSSLSECQCYILTAKENNSTGIIVPGADSEKVTFQAVRSCAVIEHNMIDCLYILCIIYGFAGIASLVTGSLSFMLLCSQRRATKEAHALQEAGLSRNRRQLSDNGAPQTNDTNRESRTQPSTETSNPTAASATTASNTTGPGRRATIGHHDVRNERPRIVQRSSSTSAAHGRQARHNLGDARGATVRGASAPQQHSNPSQRQGTRPPTLVRGGYLQIHVNGPSIPVYVVPGSSNEAFIALTDLPSLRLPSLDSVPAYVSEIADLYPSDQPPPYSPTPDEHHPPTFSAIMESPSTPTSGNRRDPAQRLVLLQEESTDQSREEQAQTQNEISAESAAQSVTPTDNPNEPGSNQTGAVQTSVISESPDQSQTAHVSTEIATPQSSPGDPEQGAESTPVSGVDVAQSREDTIQTSRVSPRTEEATEPPATTSSNTEINHPGNVQDNQTRDSPTLPESVERLPASSQSQGARPKQRQSHSRAGEEAYLAHTRSSSPSRSSPPPRTPSPQRGPPPNRRSVSPRRRQQTVSEIPPRESVNTTREATRARSNSRGRQRQLPDILPRMNHLPDTEIRNSSNRPQPASSSNREKASQKKHHQQKSSQKRQERVPQQSSHGETSSRRPPKNPDKTQHQTSSRSKSRDKPSQHNPDLKKKDSSRRDHRHRSSSAKRASGSAKIEMNIPPNPSLSSTESLTNILTLVESVHSSVKAKPKKHRKTSNEEKVNLVDSRV